MTKINFLMHSSDHTTFQSKYFQPIVEKYFNFCFDHTATYDVKNTIIVVSYQNRQQSWYKDFVDQGFKILVENLWEQVTPSIENAYICHNQNFFWYNECLWYLALGLDKYKPNKTYSKLALVPMGKYKQHRDLLFNKLPLDKCVYSYLHKGYQLPNDGNALDLEHDRYFNPKWYNDTYLSIVAETATSGDMFITEKTFKPIAFYHPFMILGQKNILKDLKKMGFETFDNLFDESYDDKNLVVDRLNIILSNLMNFNMLAYDKQTLDKLDHNHNLFFNKDLVISKITEEIINPILEFANG